MKKFLWDSNLKQEKESFIYLVSKSTNKQMELSLKDGEVCVKNSILLYVVLINIHCRNSALC